VGVIKNTWRVSIDIEKRHESPSMLFVQQDINANELDIQLFDDGKVLDISEANSATITILKPDDLVVQSTATIVDAANGKLSYTISAQALGALGNCRATIELYGDADVRITSAIFNYVVIAALDDLGSSEIVSEAEYAILTDLITTIEGYSVLEVAIGEESRVAAEELRVIAEALRVIAESGRVDAEGLRVIAEALRVTNDADRMLKTTYDPTSINGDVFDMDNMVESATKKVLTSDERNAVNYALSPTIITGGDITEGTVGTYTVAALTALLRTTDSLVGKLAYVTLAEQANQVIPVIDTNYYVCLDYNDGTPQIVLSTTNPYGRVTTPDRTQIPIGQVMKDGSNNVHYISGGFDFQDGVRKLHERTRTLRALELGSGSTIAYSGTNNFTMTAGIVFGGINKFTLALYNSAVATFTPVYGDGGVGFTEGIARNTIDFEHYDKGDGTLDNVGVAKYGVFWVYRHIDDGDVYVVYGLDSYSLGAAETAKEPLKPDHLTEFGILVGKIITPQAGGSFATIQMVSDTFFAGTSVSDHSQLGNLQGGQADEYYHLTVAQHTKLINLAEVTQNITLTATNIANKYVDLANVPIDNTSVGVFPVGGIKQLYTTDFTVITDGADVKRLNWNGLSLESLLVENDIISVNYMY